MAVFTIVPDSVLEPGDPIRSVDIIAIKDNPIAIAEGATGAPRIVTNAIQDASVTTAKLANQNVTAQKLNIKNRSFTGSLQNQNDSITIVSNDVASFSPRLVGSFYSMGGNTTGGSGSRKQIMANAGGFTTFNVTWSYVE